MGPGRIGSRVGVELVFEFNRQVSQHLLNTEVLDALVRKNLADPNKCRGLAAWTGAQRWGDGISTLYIRRVNHLKLVFVRDRPLEAKAYFGITTWVCRLAARAGEEIGERTRAFLLEHLRPDGRLATFDSSDFLEKFGRDRNREGWYSGHLCVTAAAASLPDPLIRDRTLRALAESQRDDGSWDGYWWLDREYTTALAIEAMDGELALGSRRARALEWLTSCVPPDTLIPTPHRPAGSPFASAFAVRGLAMAGETELVQRLALRLAEAQDAEGGWLASAALRLPYPDVLVPDAGHWAPRDGGTIWERPLWDQNALHTAATVVNALWHFSIRHPGGTALEASRTGALGPEPVPSLQQEN